MFLNPGLVWPISCTKVFSWYKSQRFTKTKWKLALYAHQKQKLWVLIIISLFVVMSTARLTKARLSDGNTQCLCCLRNLHSLVLCTCTFRCALFKSCMPTKQTNLCGVFVLACSFSCYYWGKSPSLRRSLNKSVLNWMLLYVNAGKSRSEVQFRYLSLLS